MNKFAPKVTGVNQKSSHNSNRGSNRETSPSPEKVNINPPLPQIYPNVDEIDQTILNQNGGPKVELKAVDSKVKFRIIVGDSPPPNSMMKPFKNIKTYQDVIDQITQYGLDKKLITDKNKFTWATFEAQDKTVDLDSSFTGYNQEIISVYYEKAVPKTMNSKEVDVVVVPLEYKKKNVIRLNIKDKPADIEKKIISMYRGKNKQKLIMCYCGGTFVKNSISKFDKEHEKSDYSHKIYTLLVPSEAVLDEKDAHIKLSSIEKAIPEESKKYASLICCILIYIQENLYKSSSFVKYFFENSTFVPLFTNLYKLSKTGKITHISLTLVSVAIAFIMRDFKDLSNIYFGEKFYLKDVIDENYVYIIDFLDQVEKHPVRVTSQDNGSLPFFIASFHDLLYRKRDVIFKDTEGKYKLCYSISPKWEINYFDPEKNAKLKKDFFEVASGELLSKDVYSKTDTFRQASAVVLDKTGSMIASFLDSEFSCGEMAMNIINSFISRCISLKVHDPLIFENDGFPNCNLVYNKDDFKEVKTDFFARIIKEIIPTLSQFKSVKKRILIVSDGDLSSKTVSYVELCKKLISNDIIVDAIILNEDESANALATIAFFTGGIAFAPKSVEDALNYAQLESLCNLSLRQKVSNFSKLSHKIDASYFDTIAKNIRYPEIISSMQPNRRSFYTPLHLMPVIFADINFDLINTFRLTRIKKEADICASYQLYARQNNIKNFFSLYYVYGDDQKLDLDRLCVFTESEVNHKTLIQQILIEFTPFYPMAPPNFRLLSNIPTKFTKSHGSFKLNIEYTPKIRLFQMLNHIQKNIAFENDPTVANDEFGAVNSLDQINSVFDIECNEETEGEKIVFKEKYLKLIS